MPNHVANEIRVIGPELRVMAFLAQGKVEGDEREFSFKGFCSPPTEGYSEGNGCSHLHPMPGMKEAIKRMLGVDCPDDHPMLLRHLEPENHPNCWYVWNRENWGTKWDAYDINVGSASTILDRLARASSEVVEEVVAFDTAWDPPYPVFNVMAELYPDLRFKFRWMNEDMQGSGGGQIDTEDSKLISGINDPDDPETGALWWELATQLCGYTKEQHEERLAEAAEDERLNAEAESKACHGSGDNPCEA